MNPQAATVTNQHSHNEYFISVIPALIKSLSFPAHFDEMKMWDTNFDNLKWEAAPNIGESNRMPFIANVVTPEYADRAFLGRGAKTSNTIVAGVSGIQYEYEFEGSPETTIVLPFGRYKLILGTVKPYEVFFKQILSTFKFLK